MITSALKMCIFLLTICPIFAQAAPLPTNRVSGAAAEEREVSWKKIAPNFLVDQKSIWLFPTQAARGSHIFPTLGVLGVTGGLLAADPIEGRYFRANSEFYHGFNRILSGTTTAAGILAVPAAFYFIGLGRKDSYSTLRCLAPKRLRMLKYQMSF